MIKTFFAWYKSNFPVVFPLFAVSVLALFFAYIPYINIIAETVTGLVIFTSVSMIWLLSMRTFSSFLWLLFIFVVLLIFFDMLKGRFLAEAFGSVLYLLLAAYSITLLWQKNSSHSS